MQAAPASAEGWRVDRSPILQRHSIVKRMDVQWSSTLLRFAGIMTRLAWLDTQSAPPSLAAQVPHMSNLKLERDGLPESEPNGADYYSEQKGRQDRPGDPGGQMANGLHRESEEVVHKDTLRLEREA